MNKTLAFVLYVALGIVTLAILVMTILASAGIMGVWNGMPVMIVLFALALGLAVSVVAFNPKKTFYAFGFYILHIGIVLFLIGSFIYTVSGVKTMAAPPSGNSFTPVIESRMMQMGVTKEQINDMKTRYYNQIRRTAEDGSAETIDLGFNFRINDFRIEYYDEKQTSVKHYEATVEFINGDGSTETESLTVNHPIYRNGWKIYLMNVAENEPFGFVEVQLLFKKDPTEFLSTSGIVLTVLGTFMMCFLRPREAMLQKKREPGKGKKEKGGAKA